MSDTQPLCASTPKKLRLNDSVAGSSYLFISDSEDSSVKMSDTQPLCDTSMKFRLNDSTAGSSSYLFVSDSEDVENTTLQISSDSSNLLFLTTEEDNNPVIIDDSESIIFLSDDDTTLVLKSDDEEISHSKDGPVKCCLENCLQAFTTKELDTAMEHFQSKSSIKQRQYLLDCVTFSSPSNASTAKEKFMLYSKPVCKRAFAQLLGTSERRLERIRQSGVTGHGNLGMKRPTNKSFDASAWMNNYFSRMGDHMPDSNRIHLPSFLTKREVYLRMCTDLADDGIKDIISLSTFYELWDKEYSHVAIPEVSCYSSYMYS